MTTSYLARRLRLGVIWPYVVAAVMIGYVIILAALVTADVGAASQILRLS